MYKIKVIPYTNYFINPYTKDYVNLDYYYYCRTKPVDHCLTPYSKDATVFTDSVEIINEIKSIPAFKDYKDIQILELYQAEKPISFFELLTGE